MIPGTDMAKIDTAEDQIAVTEARPLEAFSLISGEADSLLARVSRANDRQSHARVSTMLAINAASVLEKTDEQLLPSVYKYVGCSFGSASPGVHTCDDCRCLTRTIFSVTCAYHCKRGNHATCATSHFGR